ncbi:MAG: ABC-F family ATP-binding cassette domain-containing protein [Ruminococcaceae bacterium]|nr:ABC-F family ATP-binding cassette domain-containing protein [Oscillospiraceae bacterium]
MTVLQVLHLNKSYTDRRLLQDLTFSLGAGERVGLVGNNGCGKTTLLRMLSGQETPDSGEIRLADSVRVGYMAQLPDPRADLNSLKLLHQNGEKPQLAWQLSPDGLSERTVEQAHTLSGGERTRLALSRFLATDPDLLLLDEPTNNLDLDGIQTVIRLLKNSPGTMIIVSHDRYLLDQLVTRILEIDNTSIRSYTGNYSQYRKEKERLLQESLHRYAESRKQQRQLQVEITQKRQWADKAHRDSTKADGSGNKMGLKEYKRVKAGKLARKAKQDMRRLEQLKQTSEARPKTERKTTIAFDGQERHGKRILEAVGLSKAYPSRPLFEDSNFYILRGEKVALTGPNGCGKTTLVRLIQGLEQPDNGRLLISPSCTPVVMGQTLERLPSGHTLLTYLTDKLGKLSGADRASLEQMGFTGEHLFLQADRISPGELVRLRIAELILSHQDFLILDEPTNYLDLRAREQLEQALVQVQATLLLVSHDLYLQKAVCDKVLAFAGSRIVRREESFADYLEYERGL